MSKKEKSLALTGMILEEPKYKAQATEEVIEGVVDELEAMLVERTKQAREYTIMVAWEAGEILRRWEKEQKINISTLVARVAMDNRISGRQMGNRKLWMAIKIYDKFPVFKKIYDTEYGENISLSKLKKMLSIPKSKTEQSVADIAVGLYEKLGLEKVKALIKELEMIVKKESKHEQGK